MTVGEQLRWWGIGFGIFLVVLWFLSGAILPFVLGAALAYLTDPLADRMERAGISRIIATVLITGGVLGIGLLGMILIIPALFAQIQNAIASAPSYFEWLREMANTYIPSLADENSALRSILENLRGQAEGWSVTALQQVWNGSLAVIDFVTLIVITPVVALYLLYDWDRMIAGIDGFLPRQHRATIRRLMGEMDLVLAGFVRGQLSVCLILGTFYAVALSLLGLQFGLLIGAFAGLISFIPFVGSIVGGLLSIGVAMVQFWGEPGMIVAVAVVFAAGQAVEGNILTPYMVGGKVRLHPVWLMFALSVFGSIFGFIGLLVAVPTAAMIGVFGRFLIERYKESGLYQGSADWQGKVGNPIREDTNDQHEAGQE